MNVRIDPFATLKDVPSFDPKRRTEKPAARDVVDQVSDETGFVSRDPPKSAATPRRKKRLYRTGRNVNFSVKATKSTVDRFYKLADERAVTLGALLELALDALEGKVARKDV